MDYHKRAPSVTSFSNKLSNGGAVAGGGLTGKNGYDGDFGDAVKSGMSRMEDYKEIFSGCNNCSIPILDFPEMKESKSSGDLTRSSKPDYSMIFGGFGDSDFSVPYEDLLSGNASTKKVNSLPKQTRASAGARVRSAGPERYSSISEEKKAHSPQVSFQSFDDVKQFNGSFNKSNQRSKNGTTGMAHVSQLHSVPSPTCLVDETPLSQMPDPVKPVRTVLNDADMNINVSEGIKPGKYLRKVVSGPQPRGAAINTSPASHSEFQKKSTRNKSFSNDISFDASEIGLGTQPATMSSPHSASKLGNDNGGSMRSMNLKFGVYKNDTSEGAAGSYSPPFFDEEIDANSAAAASAAALRKAIEEAQAKLKIAKELMERKRQGLHSRTKSSFKDGLKAERREIKSAKIANGSKEEADEMHHKVYTTSEHDFNGLPKKNVTNASQIIPDISNVKKSPAVENAFGETYSRESTEINYSLEAESEKATNGFSEPVDAGEHRAIALEVKQGTNVENMKPCTDDGHESKEKMAGEENVQKAIDSDKKLETFEEAPKQEMIERWQGTNVENMKPCTDDGHESKEKMAGEENVQKAIDSDRKLETFEEAPKQETIERLINTVAAAFKWNIFRNIIKSDENSHNQDKNAEKARVDCEYVETEQTPEVPYEQKECESMANKYHEPEEPAKSETQEPEAKDTNVLKEAEVCVKIEMKETEECNKEEVENQSNEVPLRKENEGGSHEIDMLEGDGKRQKEDLNRVEYKNNQEGWVPEENERHLNAVSKTEDTEMSGHVHREEVVVVNFNQFQEKEENEERFGEDCGTKGNETLHEAIENEKMLDQIDEDETEEYCEEVEIESMKSEVHLRVDDENNMEVTQQHFRFLENNLEATNNVYKLDESENAAKANEACRDEKIEGMQVTSEVVVEENGERMEITRDSSSCETGKAKAVEEAHDLVEEDDLETGVSEQGLVGLDGKKKQTADVYLGENDLKFDPKPNGYHVMEYVEVCEEEMHIEEVTSPLNESDEDVSDSVFDLNEEESGFPSCHEERSAGTGIQSKTLCGPEKQVEETFSEIGENIEDVKEPEVATNCGDEIYFKSNSEERMNNMTSGQASFEGEGKEIRISAEESTNQSTDEEEGHHESQTIENRNTEDVMQKEMEWEREHHRRKEETKLRELEKEKERIAVERAIREARERAFAEARERAAAEKAAAKAHQRVTAENEERLGKPCAKANGKSAVEKASMEAKLKAERAAVERATAEARERALERALSEKAAFKVRNQAEKFGTEKFSSVSRDAGLKYSDQQFKGPGPSSSSKHPSSSTYDDRLNSANSETIERCRATFERNQRTAERAAKALAEKNMRDLLAQKEQAERNRLAEILDADVKRWSSGKERNLRALLSTLQYILSPDSRWQPIPLTDLVSNAAVKKAYRKATLFVHPDKLQQRGASIQQKYTCEKVFDLLKDAWNKFNAEER